MKNTAIPTTTEQAAIYHGQGLQLLPVHPGTKKPLTRWKHLQTRPETELFIKTVFNRPLNIAAIHGAISKNTVCIDYDNFQEYQTDISNPQIKRLYETLPEIHTPKGIHKIFRTPEPLKTKHSLFGKKTVDIKASGGFSMLPFSIDQAGQVYLPFQTDLEKPFPVIDPWELPERYHKFLEIETRPEYTTILQPVDSLETEYIKSDLYGLSAKCKKLITGEIQYKTRSEGEYAAIIEMAGHGWPLEHIRAIFTRYGGNSKAAAAPEWLNRQYLKAIEYVRANKSETVKQAEQLIQLLNSGYTPEYLINNRTVQTDKSVLIAIAEIVKRTSKTDLYLSQIELAELAGINNRTVWKALNRLPAVHTGKHPFFDTKQYDISELINIERGGWVIKPNTNTKDYISISTHEPPPPHDFFSFQGLGKIAYNLIQFFNQNTGQIFTVSEIAKERELNRKTVRDKLQILHELNLLDCEYIDRSGNQTRAYFTRQPITADILTATIPALEQIRKRAIEGIGKHRQETHRKMRAEHRAGKERFFDSLDKTGDKIREKLNKQTETRH